MNSKLDWEKELADCSGIVLHSRLMTLRALLNGCALIVIDPTEKSSASKQLTSTAKPGKKLSRQSPLQTANHRA